MKRIIALFLIFTLMVIIPNVEAKEKDKSKDTYYKQNSELNYIISKKSEEDSVLGSYINDGVVLLSNGIYLSPTGTDMYQIVEKIEFDLTDVEAINELMYTTSVSKETYDSIVRESNYALSMGLKELRAELYLPSYQEIPGKINTMGTITNYYTYNGYNMKDEIVYIINKSTRYQVIESGVNTKDVASTIANATIFAAGIASAPIGIVLGGISVFHDFVNLFSPPTIYGESGDYYQANVHYDYYEKHTYIQNGYYGTYSFAVESYKVNMTVIDNHQTYYVNDVGYDNVYNVDLGNKIYKSENYDHPEYVAINHNPGSAAYYDYKIKFKVGNTTFVLYN